MFEKCSINKVDLIWFEGRATGKAALTDKAHYHLKMQAQKQPALSRVALRATFRQLKFRTTDGFGAIHFKYNVVGPLTTVWNWWKTSIIWDLWMMYGPQLVCYLKVHVSHTALHLKLYTRFFSFLYMYKIIINIFQHTWGLFRKTKTRIQNTCIHT